MTTYRITLSTGIKVEILASSAANAIEKALRAHSGASVVDCYSGLKQEDVEVIRRRDSLARPIAGFIQHEIPKHDPIDDYAKAERLDDQTIPMFDEETIRSESERAKQKRDQT